MAMNTFEDKTVVPTDDLVAVALAGSFAILANCETSHPVGMHRSVEKVRTHNLAFRRNASNGPSCETLVQGIGAQGTPVHHVLRSA